jgi:hypothetical protein
MNNLNTMNDAYHAAKAEACGPAIFGGADNMADAHDAWDGAQAWPDGGLSDQQIESMALAEVIDGWSHRNV